MVQKYAGIFVCRHYLFHKANSSVRAEFEENCELQGTYNVQGQIYPSIFLSQMEALCYYP